MPTKKYASKKQAAKKRSTARAKPSETPKARPAKKAAAKKHSAVSAQPAKTGSKRKTPPKSIRSAVAASDMDKIRAALLELRERVNGQIEFLADDANHKDDTPTDDRTDEFDREFAFNLVSTEKDALHEIDSALRRIQQNSYGRCEACDGKIEKRRLQALPFARHCLRCQSNLEQSGTGGESRRWADGDQSEHHSFDNLESSESD